MKIYATSFDRETKKAQTCNDSGFDSLEAVRVAMGKPSAEYKKMLVYGEGPTLVAFSSLKFTIDGAENSG